MGEKLRSHKSLRERDTRDERIQELLEQNQYLAEKVQFLRLQKMRNEGEIVRMDTKQNELRQIHQSYVAQLNSIESLVGDWQGFHQELLGSSRTWGKSSSQKVAEDETALVVPEI